MPIRHTQKAPYECVCSEFVCAIEQELAAHGQVSGIAGMWNTSDRESKVVELRFGRFKRRFFAKIECIERLRFYLLERDGPL